MQVSKSYKLTANSSLQGFTLIELMVVCGILLVSFGFAMARFNDYNQRRRLTDEAKKVMGAMNLASKRAVSGDSGTTCADFQGFQVAVTTTGSYTMRRCCEGACNSAQSVVVSTEQLPIGITFSAPTANTTYLFNKLAQTVSIVPVANQTVTLRNTVLLRCIPLTVSPSGLITQQSEVAC